MRGLWVVRALLIAASPITVAVDVSVELSAETAIRGRPVDLHKWNSHHGLSDENGEETLLDLGTRPGRWLNPDETLFPSVPEDPQRPGFADLSWFQTSDTMAAQAAKFNSSAAGVGRQTYSLILCFGAMAWPGYLGWDPKTSTLPNNSAGAAEMIVAFISELYQGSGGLLPAYLEPVNEPNGGKIASGANSTKVKEYEVVVAQAVHAYLESIGKQGSMKVGGPAYAGINFAHNKYRGLNDLFWSSSPLQQFVSFHIFDSFTVLKNGSVVEATHAGGLIPAAFDTIQAVSIATRGTKIPLLPSEHGLATDKDPALFQALPLPVLRFRQIDSFWGQLLNLLDYTDDILTLNAFLIANKFSDDNNPPVSLFNVTMNTPTITANATFGLLRDINGATPIDMKTIHAQLQQRALTAAFSDLKNTTRVFLKNLESTPTVFNVSGCNGGADGMVKVFHVGCDSNGATTLYTTIISAGDLAMLTLGPRELSVLICSSATATRWLARDRTYAPQTRMDIPQSGLVNATILSISEARATPAVIERAILRVGFAQDYADNGPSPVVSPPPMSPPKLTFNGVIIDIFITLRTDPVIAAKGGWYGQWKAWEYTVPVTSLSASGENTLSLAFAPPPAGIERGSVSAISLETWSLDS